MNAAISSALLGYLLGSIPFGLLAAALCGIDIRKHGSGNIGATNVLRTLGKKWGIPVFALDLLKGAAAVQAAQRLFIGIGAGWHPSAAGLGIVAGIACILGHNFPIWLGFKGGKGVAASAGVLLGLAPLAVVAAMAAWLAVFYLSRYVSLASIVAALVVPAAVWAVSHLEGRPLDAIFWTSLVVAALALWRHKSNIQRLMAGNEHRFEKKK